MDNINIVELISESESFVDRIKNKYNLSVHVALGGKALKDAQGMAPLEALASEGYTIMCKYEPHLFHKLSFKSKGRQGEFISWVHCFYYIAWNYGYSKSSIANLMGKNHATVINGVKSITNRLSVHDPRTVTTYNRLLNHYSNNVGDFTKDSKR